MVNRNLLDKSYFLDFMKNYGGDGAELRYAKAGLNGRIATIFREQHREMIGSRNVSRKTIVSYGDIRGRMRSSSLNLIQNCISCHDINTDTDRLYATQLRI